MNEYKILNFRNNLPGDQLLLFARFVCRLIAADYNIKDQHDVIEFVFNDGYDEFIEYVKRVYDVDATYWRWDINNRTIGYGFKFKATEALTRVMIERPWEIRDKPPDIGDPHIPICCSL